IHLGSAETILNHHNSNTTLNSILSRTGRMPITDPTAGAITPNAADIYTGTTTINANPATTATTFTVGNVSALSNGPVTLTSGQIATSTGPTTTGQFGFFALANPVTFSNSVVTFQNSTNRIFLTGPITLLGNNQITGDANAF